MMITDFNNLSKFLLSEHDFCQHTMMCEALADNTKILYTSFIDYEKEKNVIHDNKVSAIICCDCNSSKLSIMFATLESLACNHLIKEAEALGIPKSRISTSHHPIWYVDKNVDMIKWNYPVYTSIEEAEAYRKKMYNAFIAYRNAHKKNI